MLLLIMFQFNLENVGFEHQAGVYWEKAQK